MFANGLASCGKKSLTSHDGAAGAGGRSGDAAVSDTAAGTGGLSLGTGGIVLGTGGAFSPGAGGAASGGMTQTSPVSSGGTASGGASGTAAGGAVSDGGPRDGQDAPTGSMETFCTGEAKASREGKVASAKTTAYRLEMASCCAARYGILFHTFDALGVDSEVVIMQTESGLAEGEYPLADGWRPVRANVRFSDETADTWHLVNGSVRVTGDTEGTAPFHLALCAQVASSDVKQTLTKFYVPDIAVAPEAWSDRFRISLLADEKLSAQDAAKQPLDKLVLASTALLDLKRITAVTKATGEFRVQDDSDLGSWVQNRMSSNSLLNMPFVVEADGIRIYLGSFMSPISSYAGPGALVDVMSMKPDRFVIDSPLPDLRWDPRIVKVLTEASRLIE
jgi:hypothetical protein